MVDSEDLSGKEHAMMFIKRLKEESVNKFDPFPEWTTPKLISLEFEETGGTCICKKHIHQIFEIVNKETGKRLEIGCDCAERWFGARYFCSCCKAVLGNLRKRLREQNFICPACARKEKKRFEELKKRFYGRNFWSIGTLPSCFKHKLLKELLEEEKFCNYILSLEVPWYEYKYFEYIESLKRLIKFLWEVEE